MTTETPQHPDLLELELSRTGEAEAGVAEHLASCEVCQATLAMLEGFGTELSGELPELSVSDETDQAIRAMAWEAAGRVKRTRRLRVVRWAAPVVAAAAAFMIFIVPPNEPASEAPVGPMAVRGEPAPATPAPTAVPGETGPDLNGDGKVDILDAFALARAVDTGHTRPDWDFTGEGDIDQRDIDHLAMMAVSVKGGVLR